MSGFYSAGLESLWQWALVTGARPAENIVIRCVLVNNTYVFDPSHADYAALGDSPMLDPVDLSGVVITGGLLDADDVVFDHPNLLGLTVSGIVIFLSWSAGTKLLAFIDQGGVTIPQLLSEGNVTIKWPEAGILRIG